MCDKRRKTEEHIQRSGVHIFQGIRDNIPDGT